MKITKNTTLKKILETEGSKKILKKHNLPCLSCPMASVEMGVLKIGDVSQMYDLNLEEILKDLNNLK